MKMNDGEAKETGKETGKETEGSKEGEISKAGEKEKEKEKAKDEATPKKPNTNGVVTHSTAAGNDMISTPTSKGKQRETEGGMISPESLEAT